MYYFFPSKNKIRVGYWFISNLKKSFCWWHNLILFLVNLRFRTERQWARKKEWMPSQPACLFVCSFSLSSLCFCSSSDFLSSWPPAASCTSWAPLVKRAIPVCLSFYVSRYKSLFTKHSNASAAASAIIRLFHGWIAIQSTSTYVREVPGGFSFSSWIYDNG